MPTRMETVLKTIADGHEEPVVKGYQVHFDRADGHFLRGDYFPSDDEPLIASEETAKRLATDFAAATRGRCVNFRIYISYVSGHLHGSSTVPGWRIENR